MYGAGSGHHVLLLFTCLLCAREHARSVLCTYMLYVDKCAMYGAGSGASLCAPTLHLPAVRS